MKKLIFLLLFLEILAVFVVYKPQQTALTLVTCDVGQGDAHLILYGSVQILVDAGERKDVLSCLGKYLPYSDRTIEIVILTHPDFDHSGGMESVFDRYKVDLLLANTIENSSQSYQLLKKKIGGLGTTVIQPVLGDEIKVNDLTLRILHPGTDLAPVAGEVSLGTSTATIEPNDYSITFLLNFEGITALYTGDLGPSQIPAILSRSDVSHVDLLKIPHHGSKNGLTSLLLNTTTPDISVISVGKNNRFGHPHQEILDILETVHTKIYRTDIHSDIIFKVIDGELIFVPH